MAVEQSNQSRGFKLLKSRGAAIALAMGAFLLPACEGYEQEAGVYEDDTVLTEEPAEVTEEVAEEPAAYLGEAVTVGGEVTEVFGPNTYRIQEEELFGGEELLIVDSSPAPIAPIEGQSVLITGVVREFVIADFERDYGLDWDADLAGELEAEYDAEPVVVAEATEVVEEEVVQ